MDIVDPIVVLNIRPTIADSNGSSAESRQRVRSQDEYVTNQLTSSPRVLDMLSTHVR